MVAPVKKCVADCVRMIRIEISWPERAEIMFGSLIVATEPVAQRRRCGFVGWTGRE